MKLSLPIKFGLIFISVMAMATASAQAVSRHVTFIASVQGKGKVVSRPEGVACPSKCKGLFVRNVQVRVTAQPATGWHFDRWNGLCQSNRKSSCVLRARTSGKFGAVFALNGPPPGSDRAHPAPIGTTLPISTVDTPTGWSVKVNSVNPDATNLVLAASSFNSEPAVEHQYFLASITATYKGAGSAPAGEVSDALFAVGARNVSYTQGGLDWCGVTPDPDFNSLTVDETAFTGGSYTGNICFSVYEDDVASLVMYTDTGTTSDIPAWFALH